MCWESREWQRARGWQVGGKVGVDGRRQVVRPHLASHFTTTRLASGSASPQESHLARKHSPRLCQIFCGYWQDHKLSNGVPSKCIHVCVHMYFGKAPHIGKSQRSSFGGKPIQKPWFSKNGYSSPTRRFLRKTHLKYQLSVWATKSREGEPFYM